MPERDADNLRGDLSWHALAQVLRAEWAGGILGLRLFIACVAVAGAMLGAVWMLGGGLSDALERNGLRILGGDLAVSVQNRPLSSELQARLSEIGTLSEVVELRTAAGANGDRAPVELKAVDDAYPLYGRVRTRETDDFQSLIATRDGVPGAVVEPALLSRFGIEPGATLRIGERAFAVRGVLLQEPDRLSAGSFLVGPRVLIGRAALRTTGLTDRGSLAEYRYRLRLPDGADADEARAAVEALTPDRGWDLQSPSDAGDRVRRTVDRTTTFLGVAGIVALAIGLSGAWAAARVWIARRSRTIALYRLSGATPELVIAQHAAILGAAGVAGIGLGLAIAIGLSVPLMSEIAARLHLNWQAALLVQPALAVVAVLTLGLAGAATAALSAAARTPPGAAMRSGEADIQPSPRHATAGAALIALALVVAVLSLPIPLLAGGAAVGMALAAGLLGLGGWALAKQAAKRRPRGFVGLVTLQGLADPGAAATKALTIGIGIAGITAIVAAQNSLDQALRGELPERVPDLVLIDVQPDQVDGIETRVAGDSALGGLQATPYLRASILAVNGVPADEALVAEDKSWVIEGDRSFSWAAEPTGAELLAGAWWDPAYDGPPKFSAEEDVVEAFDLTVGDELTVSVLGRPFTAEVVNFRKEYHRTFRPEFLLVGSPEPFRAAPHSWIVTLQGDTDAAVDGLIDDLADSAPNVTSIDIRPIVAQVREVIDGAVLSTLAIAGVLLVAGALSLAAVIAADVDSRRREALAFTLIGASRREIALARLAEAAGIGALAAVLGGLAGLVGGRWLVAEALHVDWAPGLLAFLLPALLGLIAAGAAGMAGGLGAAPRGRGRTVRELAG